MDKSKIVTLIKEQYRNVGFTILCYVFHESCWINQEDSFSYDTDDRGTAMLVHTTSKVRLTPESHSTPKITIEMSLRSFLTQY